MEFRSRHWRHAVTVGLVMFTGLGLFLAGWRSALGAALPWIQGVHTAGGIAYGLALVAWSVRFFPWPKAPRHSPAYTRWAFFFLVVLAVSGAGLLVGSAAVRAVATMAHAGAAAAFVLWVLVHLYHQRPATVRRTWATDPGRRRFLRWAAGAVLSLPALEAAPVMVRVVLGTVFGLDAASNAGALPGFVPYTVVGGYPRLSPETWRLRLDGLGEPRVWDWARWATEPTREVTLDFQCVTGWAVRGVRFAGVDLASWLERQGWEPARQPWVLFYSGDGVYTESLSAAQIYRYRPLLASFIDGRPLPVAQGFPLRLVVPGMYGYKSIKWLVRIRLAAADELGFWEVRGYPQDAYVGSYNSLTGLARSGWFSVH
ncbi:MAG: molybdopterin-dependent oxidoreductase [Actinomycetia bacterium]|nr:molybdopterin-dependent oxidoreductase [Actinomycetes bacterium]